MADKWDTVKNYKGTICLIVVLNIVVVILIILTLHYTSSEYQPTEPEVTPFCLPCTTIQQHPDDGMPFGIDVDDDSDTCCAKNESYIHTLVKQYVVVWHGKKLHEENPQFSRCRERILPKEKPLIKLALSEEQTAEKPTDLLWNELFQRTNHVTYSDGYINVKKPGLYFVYSKVSFIFKQNITRDPGFPRRHQIILKRFASPEGFDDIIARGTSSNCQYEGLQRGYSHNSTSFIGSVYRLHPGDRVSVTVHDRNQLLDAKGQVFGLHMI